MAAGSKIPARNVFAAVGVMFAVAWVSELVVKLVWKLIGQPISTPALIANAILIALIGAGFLLPRVPFTFAAVMALTVLAFVSGFMNPFAFLIEVIDFYLVR